MSLHHAFWVIVSAVCLAALLVLRGRPASVSRTTQEPTEPVHCDRITKTT
ncbi:MAG TPA: hypothetical protein VIP75_05965 [Acidothermales bacterium]